MNCSDGKCVSVASETSQKSLSRVTVVTRRLGRHNHFLCGGMNTNTSD